MANQSQMSSQKALVDEATEVTALNENFDSSAGFTTSTGFFSDGFGDYFGLAGGGADFGAGTTPTGLKNYEGTDGGFLTGQDLDGEGATLPITAEWKAIDIAGLQDLRFQGKFAEFFDSPGDIDAGDYLKIEIRVDSGEWETILAFAGADFTSGSFNGNFRQDNDLDGVGDGTQLTGLLQEFTANIASTGTSLDLRFSTNLEAGDEDFAIDSFRVIGTSGGEATPAVIARAGDGLAVAEAGGNDSFTLELATEPTAPVEVTIAAPDAQSEVSIDGENFGQSALAQLTGTDPVTIYVRAIDDEDDEASTHTGALSFAVASADPDYNGLSITDLSVSIADNDQSITLISAIQGQGAASGMVGQEVTVEAVVTGIITNGFGVQVGYYIQEEDADADGNAATSEGIYVYSNSPVSVGDQLRLTGDVSEYGNLTQLEFIRDVQVLETGAPLPTVTQITLGMRANFETFEGMRVELVTDSDDPLTVVTNFNLDRFGEIEVAEGNLVQPTQIYDAQTQADLVSDLAATNATARFTIDDSSTGQNSDTITMIDSGDGTPLEAGDTLTANGPTLRLGTELSGVAGIMDERHGSYRIQVDKPLDVIAGSADRPLDAPDVGGDLQVASFNVLNYFTTLNANGAKTGPNGDLEPRGAVSAADLERQTDKLVAAITQLDAEILALQEIENNGFGDDSAIAQLVDALNAATAPGTYAYVDPGLDFVGEDAITTGIIYRADRVTLQGSAILEYTEDSSAATMQIANQIEETTGEKLGDYQRNRPSMAATFETANGAELTVVANHLKSKGESGLEALLDAALAANVDPALIEALRNDPNFDQGNGQGFWNGVREEAATELANWLKSNPTAAGSTDNILVLGDMNSYAKEDPVQALQAGGMTDLASDYLGDDAYSYVFDGQRGTLDYGFASAGLLDNVTGVAEWHVNADEPDLFSYSSEFNNPSFYNADPFSVSDHDPLLVGLTLEPEDQMVISRLDFGDTDEINDQIRYSEDGTEIATDAPFVSAESRQIAGSDISIFAEGQGQNLLAMTGEGLGVNSTASDAPSSPEADQLDRNEVIRFTLDDEGRLTDALDVTLEITPVTGRGNVKMSFYNDGILVDEFGFKPSGDTIYHQADEAFDEVAIRVQGHMGFEITAVDFTRTEDDSFTFV